MFSSLEELKSKYPIGTITLWSKEEWVELHYYSEADLKVYRQEFQEIQILNDHRVNCLAKRYPIQKVDGYLFDGEGWYPVEQTWDGWVEIKI